MKSVRNRILFCSVFSRIETKYGELLCKTLYTARIRKRENAENMD